MQRNLACLFLSTAVIAFSPAPFSVAAPGRQDTAPLTHIRQIAQLSHSQAAQGLPVQLEGTVTFFQPYDKSLFLTEDGLGQFIKYSGDINLQPGDRVAVTGVTSPSFRPDIVASQVRFLAHGPMPTPKPAQFEDLIQSKLDGQYVQVSGHVLSAAFDQSTPATGLRIRMQIQNGIIEAAIARPGDLKPDALLDADVRLSGVAGGDFDTKMQMAGVWLDMNSSQEVEILKRPDVDPWSIPAIPMENVVAAFRYGNQSQRVRITGTLTYFEPGALAVIEKQGKTMLLETRSALPIHAGQGVEASGFPEISESTVRMVDAQLRPIPESFPVQPVTINWESASAGQYAYNLVSMEGIVVGTVHDSRVDLFIIQADGHLFSASMRHDSSDAPLVATGVTNPSVGSRVRVTGVCFVDAGNHWRDRLWFDLHMRSLADLTIMQEPSWWTPKRLGYLISALSVIILGAVVWAAFLEKRLRQQDAFLARQSQEEAMRERQMSRQEQHRSRILEMISSSEPLPEVLREIQSMVSARLFGASCWFELTSQNGGNPTLERPTGPAIVFEELFSPDGVSLGFLLATPRIQSKAQDDILAALKAGARLAELAIDTRRLYSDLRHRSEYDLLTDIPNRFSMEKQFKLIMENANQTGAIFGLIYIDFDRFKQVNDRYGHRVGDLYLQEGTRRMKAQLRNGDMLARIGGDEFLALVPVLRSRADVEEIATRLERCFDDPFEIERMTLLGSASVGLAVYPEDGTTEEELQRSADAAMYANKESKRHQEKLDEAMRRVWEEDLMK